MTVNGVDVARELLAEATGQDSSALADGASIETCEAWDSLAHMRLMLAIEERLGHPLDAEVMLGIADLEDVARALDGAAPATS